jgi:hypothetical protein
MPTETSNKQGEKVPVSNIIKELMNIKKASLSPFERGVNKFLEEQGYNSAAEATPVIGPQAVQQKAGLDGNSMIAELFNQRNPTFQQDQPVQQGTPQQFAQKPQDQGRSFLNKLLMSVGSGMATAGGHGEIVNGLLNYAVEQDKLKQKALSGEDEALTMGRELNNQLMQAQLNALNQQSTQNANDEFNKIPESEKEDYLVKPVQQKIRGVVTTVPILERKKTLPSKELSDLAAIDDATDSVNEVVSFLKEKGLQMGPGFSTTRGAIADMISQLKGEDFNTLKSKIGRSFQKYRKWATGVAAGYQELSLLGPNYIKPTDTNENLIAKALDIAAENERNRNTMLDTFSSGGYAVSKLRRKDVQKSEKNNGGGLTPEEQEELKALEKKFGGK